MSESMCFHRRYQNVRELFTLIMSMIRWISIVIVVMGVGMLIMDVPVAFSFSFSLANATIYNATALSTPIEIHPLRISDAHFRRLYFLFNTSLIIKIGRAGATFSTSIE